MTSDLNLTLILALVFVCGAAGLAEASHKLSLAKDSVALYRIVIPADATPQEINAADELKFYLDSITKGSFRVAREGAFSIPIKSIFVGNTAKLHTAFPGVKFDSLSADTIFLKASENEDIFIYGEGQRGTLYAVYSFLEDFCKVRWYTPEVEVVPSDTNLRIDAPNLLYSPQMDYRESFYMMFNNFGGPEENNNLQRIKYCVKLKNNGFFNSIPAEWGGQSVCLPGGWPVFSRLIPTDKYFDEHPEWFSEIDGERVPAQLCLSNEEMRKEMARNLLSMIRGTPGADMITITHNDSGKRDYCRCERCSAEDEKEGAHSGLLLQCVNTVAEIVEKEYPDRFVNTLAYTYNFTPPNITKPRHNVSIQICCAFPSDAVRFDSKDSKDFYAGLKAWSGLSSRMLAWTYLIDFGDVLNPIPNTFNIGPNIRTLAKNKVKGVFAQGNSYAPIGDFPELKGWLLAKMLWDPSLNDKALIKEFMDAFYGASAKPLYKYLELVTKEHSKLTPEARAKAFSHNAYASPPKLTPWMRLDAMNQATRLFAEAEKLAGTDEVLLERVKRVKMSLEFQWIIGWEDYKNTAVNQNKEFLGPENRLDAFNIFIADCQKRGVWRLCEGSGSLNVLYPAIFVRK